MIDISFKVKRQGGRRRLISFPIYSFILFFSFFLLFFLYCSFIMSKIADTATNKLDWFFILVATWISSKLILVVHFCASTLHYLFWYILIQKRRKQNSFFIEHLWWVLLKMSVNRAVGSFFIFYSSPPPKKRNLDQNVNDSKFHFVILFLKIIFQTYTTFSYLSKRSSGHHQGFLWFQIF